MNLTKHIEYLENGLKYYNEKLKSNNINDILNEDYYLEKRFYITTQLHFINIHFINK